MFGKWCDARIGAFEAVGLRLVKVCSTEVGFPLSKRRLYGTVSALSVLAAAQFPNGANAQSVWQGTTSDYETGSNWSTGSAPTSAGQSALFPGTGSLNVTLNGNVSPDSWGFSGFGSAYTISGGSVTFSGSTGIQVNGGWQTINSTIGEAVGTSAQVYVANGAQITLNGANTYSGGTNIQGGAYAGNDRAFGTGTVTIGNGSAVVANSDITLANALTTTFGAINLGANGHTFKIDGDISGNVASVSAIGPGRIIITSTNNTYDRGTYIFGATLEVNGSIASSSGVQFLGGDSGTLMGTGNLPSVTMDSFAVFAPGSGVAGTSQTVNGGLDFTAGGTYRVVVNPTQASSATITGAATLAGGTVNAIFAAGSYASRIYNIMSFGSRSGSFDSLTTTGLPSGFSASLGYTANNVQLILTLNNPFSPMSSLPGNQRGPANSIANYFDLGGNLPPGFVTLVGLTGQAQQLGYSQTSGEGGNGATQQTTYTATNQFINTILDPSIEGRNAADGAAGNPDDGNDALAYAAERKATPAQRAAYAAVTPREARGDTFGGRWSMWASGYGGSASVDGNATRGTHNTTSRIYGTAVGVDHRVDRNTIIGFAMGGAGTSFDTSQGLGGGHSDLFQLGVYGRHNIGAAYIAGALAYGWQDVTTNRTVTVAGTDQLQARFNSNTFAARLEGGYRFATSVVGVTPYAALQSTTVHLPGYAETATTGSNQFALTFGSDTSTNIRGEFGIRTDKAFFVQDGRLTLRGRAAWAHDSNTDRIITPTFQTLPGSGSFTVNGAKPAADSLLFTAGAEMKWRNGWAVAGKFEGEFSKTTNSYAGMGTVRYAW